MGFSPQPNQWQCGPFALKHALLTLGVFAHEKDISRVAGTHPATGTDDAQLRRAARKFDCDFPLVRRYNPSKARRELNEHLSQGCPALLCIDEWSHWVAVVAIEAGQYVVVNSEDDNVVSVRTWSQLRASWVYKQPDELDEHTVHTIYDLYPVVPRFKVQSPAHFSIARVRYLRRPENRVLAWRWDEYVTDLLQLCRLRTSRTTRVISMGEFLRRHEELIVGQVDYWHGRVDRRAARRVLAHMHFAADTLGMVIHEEHERRAIAGITTLLTLWAAYKYGTAPVYKDPPEPTPKVAKGGRTTRNGKNGKGGKGGKGSKRRR